MKVQETRVDRFLASNETVFAIPVYQRNYDWTHVQCRQLLNDILSVGKEENFLGHFIGSIVYVHDGVFSASGVSELTIIDGQQRLTTLTLIFIALFRYAADAGEKKAAERIKDTYLINKYADDAEKLKLKPTDNNKVVLAQIMDPEALVKEEGYSRLLDNFRFFEKRVNESNFDVVQSGLKKLIFVDIALDRQKDNPQRIFESLNSTGVALSQADLIRNYVLMGLPHDEQKKIFNNYWAPIEENARNHKNNKSLVSDFIRNFLTFKQNEIAKKSAVYATFKECYPEPSSQDLSEALEELRQLSEIYTCLINPDREEDQVVRRELEYVRMLEVNVAHPFLMPVYRDYRTTVITRDEFVEVLRLIQSYVWRRFFVGMPPNPLNRLFRNLYGQIDQADYLPSLKRSLMRRSGTLQFPLDAKVVETIKEKDMYSIESRTRIYFFDRLENHNNRELVDITKPEITVEHIFPRNPELDWENQLSREELEQLKDEYLNTVGNLTLSGNNGSLGNKTFAAKRDMNKNGGEQGYRFSRLWLNRDLLTLETWGVEQVKARAERIAERFLEIWPAPVTNVADDADSDEVNIFDADDPTGKSLEYAVFFGKRLQATKFIELYGEVFKSLMALSPESFRGSKLGKKLEITTNRRDLRRVLEIADGYFIEGNLSALSSFERMKLALAELELEDELFIKFA